MNSFNTYFAIIYEEDNFDLEEFKLKLNLYNFVIEEYGKKVCENKFVIKIGHCNKFNLDINIMIRDSIKELIGKEEILLELKNKYNLEYYLERVVYLKNIKDGVFPILSLDNDIIEFLYKTKTIDDLDYYF